VRNRLLEASRPRAVRPVALATALLALALLAHALPASAATAAPGAGAKPADSVTLEECVTASEASERSATFSGEMSTLPGATHMEMRIDVLERQPQETAFHAVSAPGLGVWRSAAPGVKTYRYLKQVTNLSAPAYYRAAVRFRWLNAKGRLLRSAELRTPRCLQTVQPGEAPPTNTPATTRAPGL
jgi:hypothetical protein